MATEVSTVSLATGPTVSYAEQGDRRGPALVLLPGPTDSWVSYQPVLERMPLSIRTIAVSQRGHGDSDKPATGYRVENFSDDVVPLLDALRIERAILAGHSGSCLVARRVAIDAPAGRVAGLVLEASPTTLRADAALEALVESVVADLDDPIDPDFARSFLVDSSSSDVAPEVIDQQVGELLEVPRVCARNVRGTAAVRRQHRAGAHRRAGMLIWGDSDGVVGREMQEQLEERIPCAELVVYHGVGHTPRWEDPARFAADVAAFVERVIPQI